MPPLGKNGENPPSLTLKFYSIHGGGGGVGGTKFAAPIKFPREIFYNTPMVIGAWMERITGKGGKG